MQLVRDNNGYWVMAEKSNKTYISLPNGIDEMYSLPNGTKDEIVEGKFYKKIKSIIVDDSLADISVWSRYEDFIETIGFRIENVTGIKVTTSVVDEPFVNSANYAPTTHGTIYRTDIEGVSSIFGNCYVSILRSKLTTEDVAGFTAWLSINPIIIYYELATPEVYDISNDVITAYENGTMYVSPALTENYTYNNGITFESKVVTIDSVIDINGDEVEYTLAEDGMSLTITNGVNGDAYHVYGNIEGLTPIIGFEYPTNIKTQVSSLNAGQIKQTSRIMTLEDTLAMLIVQNA